jgi:hypothetical protein
MQFCAAIGEDVAAARTLGQFAEAKGLLHY